MIQNIKKLLVIAAHPDDEILGCGATVARLSKEGWKAETVILGQGLVSRGDKNDAGKLENQLDQLKEASRKANSIIGVKKVHFADFPDNRFDSTDLLDIVKFIEPLILEIEPSLILTHFSEDLNIDHRCTFEAVITATRPQPGCRVKEILSFEVPSSTEWRYPQRFSPSVFFDVSSSLEHKLKALESYETEMRQFPHPRSLEAVTHLARWRGAQAGLNAAEAFISVREII